MAFGVVGRQWIAWKAAWQAESGHPLNTAVPEGRTAEFLPEALDLQQVPLSPIGRALLWTILIGFAVGVGWTMLVQIDAVTMAHGRIVLSGDATIIHPLEASVLAVMHVQDGQTVKQGDVLIELAPTRTLAARDRAGQDYRALQVEAARLRALIKNEATLQAPADADEGDRRVQQQLLGAQLAEHRAKIVAAQHLVDQRRAVVVHAKEAVLQGQLALSAETERAEQQTKLFEQGVGAKIEVLQAESRRVERGEDVIRQQRTLRRARAILAEAEQQYHTLVSDFQQTKQTELSALETKSAALEREAANAEQTSELQQVRAPIDGVVQQLAVHTVGTIVTPAEPMFTIVPLNRSVGVEAYVEHKDVGAVHTGQPVKVTIDMVQMPSYRTIPGHVLTVSDAAEPINTREPVSRIHVSLDRSTIQVGSTAVTLTPGMAVMVEIKTGQRRMIEYLLKPWLDSVYERLRK